MTPNTTTWPLKGASTTPIAAIGLAAVCIAWVVVALIHPTSLTDDDIPTWMVVHIAQLVIGGSGIRRPGCCPVDRVDDGRPRRIGETGMSYGVAATKTPETRPCGARVLRVSVEGWT